MTHIEESAKAACEKNRKVVLEIAKGASTRVRALIRFQEQAGLSDSYDNIDLIFIELDQFAKPCISGGFQCCLSIFEAVHRSNS